ncbi:MAG: hypothetical protein AAF550_02645, partial [Myxococcota bacterium]
MDTPLIPKNREEMSFVQPRIVPPEAVGPQFNFQIVRKSNRDEARKFEYCDSPDAPRKSSKPMSVVSPPDCSGPVDTWPGNAARASRTWHWSASDRTENDRVTGLPSSVLTPNQDGPTERPKSLG